MPPRVKYKFALVTKINLKSDLLVHDKKINLPVNTSVNVNIVCDNYTQTRVARDPYDQFYLKKCPLKIHESWLNVIYSIRTVTLLLA